jgi:hypothetical protein
MRRQINRLFPLLLLLLLPCGCKKSGSTNPGAAEKVSSSSAPPQTNAIQSERVALKVKWPLGAQFLYRFDLEQHSTNTIAGTPQAAPEDVNVGLTYALAVLHAIASGGRELEIEFLAYDMAVKSGGQLVVGFDSSQSATNETEHPVPPPFRKLIGSKLHLLADTTGKVTAVVGLHEWLTNLVGDPPGPAGQMLLQQLNEGFLQQLADFARGLPTNAVAVGESWPYQAEVPAGALGNIAVASTIALKSWETRDHRRFALIEAKGTLNGIPPQDSDGQGHWTLDAGTTASRTWFDPELGAPVESIVEQTMRLKGQLAVPAGAEAQASDVITDIGQKVTVKLIEFVHPGQTNR